MKIIKTLLHHLKALAKLSLLKSRRNQPLQVNLNIKEANTETAQKYFCYYTERKCATSQQALTMKNEEIPLANVTQFKTSAAKVNQTTLPMEVETIIVNLFEQSPVEKSHSHKQHGTY